MRFLALFVLFDLSGAMVAYPPASRKRGRATRLSDSRRSSSTQCAIELFGRL